MLVASVALKILIYTYIVHAHSFSVGMCGRTILCHYLACASWIVKKGDGACITAVRLAQARFTFLAALAYCVLTTQ